MDCLPGLPIAYIGKGWSILMLCVTDSQMLIFQGRSPGIWNEDKLPWRDRLETLGMPLCPKWNVTRCSLQDRIAVYVDDNRFLLFPDNSQSPQLLHKPERNSPEALVLLDSQSVGA